MAIPAQEWLCNAAQFSQFLAKMDEQTAAIQAVALNNTQFAVLTAKLDAIKTAITGVSLTVTNPPVDLAVLIQAVRDLNNNNITLRIGDGLGITTNGKRFDIV